MNLIKQLGGYEAAKANIRELVSDYDEGVTGKTKLYDFQFSVGQVEQALLKYRRQHNIFEVGDYILTNDDASDGKVYEIEKNHFNEHFKIRSKDGFRYCRIWRIERHATDKEIQAGRRL